MTMTNREQKTLGDDNIVPIKTRVNAPLDDAPPSPSTVSDDGSGSGGNGEDIERRLIRLEERSRILREDIGEIKSDLKEIVVKITRIPTRIEVIGIILALAGLIVGVIISS